ncbi:hypothetical protein W822_04920 [Advenella kashmirensis W13003]|uniref:Uncharacterized protein n=1 Tax=Advenella kashmirensis W13003 TaxID=1424334 RepID=V8QYM2_9BURK|nr:hypothetical protein W822_04920 [Advenella kashmirensis W13003]
MNDFPCWDTTVFYHLVSLFFTCSEGMSEPARSALDYGAYNSP